MPSDSNSLINDIRKGVSESVHFPYKVHHNCIGIGKPDLLLVTGCPSFLHPGLIGALVRSFMLVRR